MEEKMEQKIFPTWGYKSDGSAQIFDLKEEDGDLPEGWSRQMELWNHPNTRNLHNRPAEPVRGESQEAEPRKRGPGRPPRPPEDTGL
jgi:hypothetical protein